MYNILLIIMGAVIVFLAVRIVMKFRELGGSSTDEEELSDPLAAQLPKELRELKIDDPQAENWDSNRPAEEDPAREEKPPEDRP